MKLSVVLLFVVCCLGRFAAAEQLPLLGLARVRVRVADLDKGRAFYSGIAGFEDAFDARKGDGSLAAAYYKVNDLQFLEIVPGLKANDVRPMAGIAIRTDQIKKLRTMLLALGLNPGKIHTDADGSTAFGVTNLPGQDLDYLEFVQYGPKSLADRTKGQFLGAHRLSAHLEHAGIIATNFDSAYDFYVKKLGFHETWRRLTADGSRVVIDHIEMPGPSGDFVELSNQGDRHEPLTRKPAGSVAHCAFTVPDVNSLVSEVHTLEPRLQSSPARYGLDKRWGFNLFDPDGTRVEFLQVADPAHPAPAVVVTPADWGRDLGLFEGQSDVGNPALRGSASYDVVHGQYTVSGAGANMWASKDEFHFVWRQVAGDFSLTATVRFPKQEAPSHRKAALMARQSLDGGGAYVDAVVHGSGLTELQFRETPGDSTHAIRFPIEGPVRIRLERKAGWFTMYAAADGQPLQELGSYQLKLTKPVYLGLAICSHDAIHIETAVFSDVSLQEIPANQPQQ